MTVAPAVIAVRQTSATNAGSERVASSQENSTSSTSDTARSTDERACSTTSCGSMPSFISMWTGLVARKMWMRERRAPARASPAASRSSARVRASDATVGPVTEPATARTPSKSPGDAPAKPASITSTPRRCSCPAISAFSCGCSAMPGDCSPSRSVVSKTWILRGDTNIPSFAVRSETHLWCGEVGVCGYVGRVFVYSP
jgi:hypothetical protein